MSTSRRPRKRYDPSATGKAALTRIFNTVRDRYIAVSSPPATLYHYCDEEVFRKILRSRTLWASDILRMEDRREVTYAFSDVISPLVAEREKSRPKYFFGSVAPEDQIQEIWGRGICTHIACLSSSDELASQWKRYAKCEGYAIGFNRDSLQAWCNACGLAGFGVTLIPMIYDAKLQTMLTREFLEKERLAERSRCTSLSARAALQDEAKKHLAILAMTLKDPQYHREKEWRILVIQRNGGRFTRLTREKTGEPDVGYFELPVIGPDLVTEIVLGPLCTKDPAEIRTQLINAGIGGADIRSAKCECEKFAGFS